MNGIIKLYKEEKGYGFILGEDEKQYFFHISNVKSTEIPEVGLGVSFTPDKNEKGLLANNVEIKNTLTRKFIILGGERIKLSNIKNYGIASETVYYQKVYKFKPAEGVFGHHEFEDIGEWKEIPYLRYYDIARGSKNYMHIIRASKGEPIGVVDPSKRKMFETSYKHAKEDGIYDLNYLDDFSAVINGNPVKSDVKEIKEDYLYITSYQGDNYKFSKNNAIFNIHEKLRELDEILT